MSQTSTGEYPVSLDYAYDLSGRMISESRTENGTALESSYIYDALGQLTEFKQSNGYSENYSYDAVGNMSAKTVNGIKTNYTYNAANQLISDGTSEYSYDANGNLVEKSNDGGVTSYTYNALSLLENWTDGSTSENYSYNASGLLSSVENNGVTTELTWDILYGDGEVIESRTNEAVTDYTYGLERISALTDKTRTEYVYDGRGSVAAELSYNTAWYTLGGALSDKSAITKSYTPFGEQLTEETSGFGYNGEYYNAVTGTVYLRARFYEPEMNRFSQKDIVRGSIANPNSLNRYSYVQNDPINFIDPSGESLRSAWNSVKSFANNAVKKVENFVNNTISKVKNIFGGGSKPTSSAGSSSNTIITNTQTGSGSGAFSTTCLMGYGGKTTPNMQNPSVGSPTANNYMCNIKTTTKGNLDWKKVAMVGLSTLEVGAGIAITTGLIGSGAGAILILGNALLGSGVSSMAGGLVSEHMGDPFSSGWSGGQVGGAITGGGLGVGPALGLPFLKSEAVSTIGGFLGGIFGSSLSQPAESKKHDSNSSLKAGAINSAMTAFSGVFSQIPSAILADISTGIIGKVFGSGITLINETIFDTSSAVISTK